MTEIGRNHTKDSERCPDAGTRLSEEPPPRVDVFVVAYERPEWTHESVASILAQSFTDFRLLVSDDSPSNRVRDALEEFTSNPRFHYVRHTPGVGMSTNWNDCIRRARAEMVAIFHDDDVYHADILRRSVELLDEHPNVGFVHSAGVQVDEKGAEVRPIPHSWPRVTGSQDFIRRLGRGKTSYVVCPTVVARRSLYQQAGLFRENPGPGNDKEMWIRMARWCDVGFIADPMIRNRVRTGERAGPNEWGIPAIAMLLELAGEQLPQSYGMSLAGRLWGELRFALRRNIMCATAVLRSLSHDRIELARNDWSKLEPYLSPPLRQAMHLLTFSPNARILSPPLKWAAALRRAGRQAAKRG